MTLPNKWQIIPLEELAEVRSGVTLSQKVILDGVELPYLRVANVQDGKIDLTEIKDVTVEKNKVERFLLKKGDILLTEGGDFDKLGRGAVWQGEIESCLHQNHVFAVRIKGKLLPEFFAALTRTHHGRTYFLSCAKRSTNLASINSSQLKRFPVILPPLAEQKKIVEILSTWDEAISVVDRQLENCRQQKKALMQKLLTGKKRLPGFSGEWRSCSLGELGKFYKGEGIAKDDVQSEGFPCVRYGEIYTRHFDYIRKFYSFISNDVAQKSFPLQSGDILFTCSGETPEEIGKTVAYVGDEIVYAGGDIIILRPEKEDSVFLGYYLNSDEIVSQKISFSQGKSVVHISAKSLQKIKCRLPQKNEQTAIAKIFISVDNQMELLEEKKVCLITEKQALMQQLLTGKKRVAV